MKQHEYKWPAFNFPTTTTQSPITTIKEVVTEYVTEMVQPTITLGETTNSSSATGSFALNETAASNSTAIVGATDLIQNGNVTNLFENATTALLNETNTITEKITTLITETTSELVSTFTTTEKTVDWLKGNNNETVLNMHHHSNMQEEYNYVLIYIILGVILGVLCVISIVLILIYVVYKKKTCTNLQGDYTMSNMYIASTEHDYSVTTKNIDAIQHGIKNPNYSSSC